jgi:ubiquinone/menaquinone biosynthesis C-methylase UbiE
MSLLSFVALIVLFVGIIIVFGCAIWWLFIETEGIYLGKRVVIWLYDIYATRYDRIKGNDDVDEHIILAAPMMAKLRPHENPLILDVASGTGRMPLALCQHARFDGYIIGLDLSRQMLAQASQKISANHFDDYVAWVWANGEQLPFEDNTFDVVTCMEALEFMPHPPRAVAELCRVLRPNGILLTTLRWNAKWIPTIWDEATLRTWLQDNHIESIDVHPWQMDYKLVWGRKHGTSDFVGARPLDEILRCPKCQKITLIDHTDHWHCASCNTTIAVSDDNVIELASKQM